MSNVVSLSPVKRQSSTDVLALLEFLKEMTEKGELLSLAVVGEMPGGAVMMNIAARSSNLVMLLGGCELLKVAITDELLDTEIEGE